MIQHSNQLKVYGIIWMAAAGSSVNGTSARFKYTATANRQHLLDQDDNGNNLLRSWIYRCLFKWC